MREEERHEQNEAVSQTRNARVGGGRCVFFLLLPGFLVFQHGSEAAESSQRVVLQQCWKVVNGFAGLHDDERRE